MARPRTSGFPFDYQRTVIVGRGTPSSTIGGIFQDKSMLEVDRTGGPHDGNVYVCWTRFTGAGQNKVYFSPLDRLGATFSQPISISRSRGQVRAGLRHRDRGRRRRLRHLPDVHRRTRTSSDGLAFARSTDGGESFSPGTLIRNITAYFPSESAATAATDRSSARSDFVFHRVPLEPRVTADQTASFTAST